MEKYVEIRVLVMEKYFKKKTISHEPSPSQQQEVGANDDTIITEKVDGSSSPQSSKRIRVDLNTLKRDPAERQKISSYHPNDRNEIRRAYLMKGPFQPMLKSFPQRNIGGKMRKFNPQWYDSYRNWLEYSEIKNEVYCLPCYLFKNDVGGKVVVKHLLLRVLTNGIKNIDFKPMLAILAVCIIHV
jgi:hypothetical protein